jgi:exodeoxyribonuclease VII large subunit
MEEIAAQHNAQTISVSELSGALKRTIESNFEYVRVRGEISGCKVASSGHVYFDLKDDKALINAVCWKGVAAKLPAAPQNGMEVICTGRISTYAGRSNYQLIAEHIELSGAGALAALLEARKKQFIAEGLFSEARKRPLPTMPLCIGVVTSPTGAVIRDILHRLRDRFPVRVLLWGVLVQGKGADAQVADAINGFNQFDGISTPPPPDLLIIARGGGSMEDLWSFNEENVVRAASNSRIPLISAIGHETDLTLLDFVADKRAPTPTAAAEMAVPVRTELILQLDEYARRLKLQTFKQIKHQNERLENLVRNLSNPKRALELKIQRLDEWSERLQSALKQNITVKNQHLIKLQRNLDIRLLDGKLQNHQVRLDGCNEKAINSINSKLQQNIIKINNLSRMLESLSHQSVLSRGYAYLSDATSGALIISSKQAQHSSSIKAHLYDGVLDLSNNHSELPPVKTTIKNKKAKLNNDVLSQDIFDL